MDAASPQPARAESMKPWSWFLIIFVTMLVGLSQWARHNPYDIGGTTAATVGTLLIPLGIAYLVRGRRSKRDWNSFARWYFWLALIGSALQFASH